MREYLEPDGTFSPATSLAQEIDQLRRLKLAYPDLDDSELAHRMTTTVKQVRRMTKLL